MRRLSSLVSLAALTVLPLLAGDPPPASPKKIGPAEAAQHYQETCIVTGKVAQVSLREKLVYLNLEKPFPDTPFTGIVFARATNQFGDLSKLQGKQVELQGRIEEYRGKPQIVLNTTNQLTVIESAGKAP